MSKIQKLHNYLWESPNPQCTLHLSHAISRPILSILRLIFMLYQVCLTIIAPIFSQKPIYLIAYMTHWGCFFCTLYFICINIVLIKINIQNNESRFFSIFWKFTHLLFEIASVLEFTIFIFFWLIIFPLTYHYSFNNFHALFINISLHLFTPMCIFTEAGFNFIKYYQRHLWIILIIEFLYGVNNCAWTLEKQQIYPLVTWKNLVSYLVIAFGFGLTVMGFFFGIKLHKLKEKYAVVEVDKPYNEPLIIDNKVVKPVEDLEDLIKREISDELYLN